MDSRKGRADLDGRKVPRRDQDKKDETNYRLRQGHKQCKLHAKEGERINRRLSGPHLRTFYANYAYLQSLE